MPPRRGLKRKAGRLMKNELKDAIQKKEIVLDDCLCYFFFSLSNQTSMAGSMVRFANIDRINVSAVR